MKNPLRLPHNAVSALVLFVLFAISAIAQDIGCENFKEGKFAYAESENKHWKVERFGAYQFEHSEKYDVLFVASLEWIDECSYLLQYVSVSNPEYFSAYGKLLHCEVMPLGGDRYEVLVDDEGKKLTYTMEKLPKDDVTEAK